MTICSMIPFMREIYAFSALIKHLQRHLAHNKSCSHNKQKFSLCSQMALLGKIYSLVVTEMGSAILTCFWLRHIQVTDRIKKASYTWAYLSPVHDMLSPVQTECTMLKPLFQRPSLLIMNTNKKTHSQQNI